MELRLAHEKLDRLATQHGSTYRHAHQELESLIGTLTSPCRVILSTVIRRVSTFLVILVPYGKDISVLGDTSHFFLGGGGGGGGGGVTPKLNLGSDAH